MTRITLSDRTAIEAGIYARQSLTEIAAKIGKTTIAVSREIRKNCTQFGVSTLTETTAILLSTASESICAANRTAKESVSTVKLLTVVPSAKGLATVRVSS